MKTVKNSRAYAPLWTIAIGSILAGAVAIGHTWGDALITEVVTLAISLVYFFVTGRDSDVGAIYGQRSDERQRDVRARASRLGFVAAILAAYACAAISVAMNKSYWQADVIASVGGVGFLLGIAKYGAHDERGTTPYHGIMSSAASVDDLENGDESASRAARELDDATGEI
jgi:peptidoglycan/LPS O-acetylase OafA/YrhL